MYDVVNPFFIFDPLPDLHPTPLCSGMDYSMADVLLCLTSPLMELKQEPWDSPVTVGFEAEMSQMQ